MTVNDDDCAGTGAAADVPVFFDANVSIGTVRGRDPDTLWRTEAIRAELSRCGVAAALCRNALGKVDTPCVANAELLRETENQRGLYPLGVVTPSLLDLVPDEEEQLARLVEAGIRAVIAHPASHNVGLSPRHWGRWADVLASASLPLFVEFAELPGPGDFEKVYDWFSLFDSTPVVLLGAPWSAARNVLGLMATNPNLHLETSNWQAHGCPEFLVRHFGAGRVVFGTGQPAKSPGAARAAVDYADLREEEKAEIAGEDLQRLLQLPELAPWPVEPPSDALAALARRGRPLPVLVADAHSHVMASDQRMVSGTLFPDSSPEQQVKINDRLGVDIQCQASWTGPVNASARLGNDILLASQESFPDIVVPMATVDPTQMTTDEMAAEIDRMFRRGPAAGLKPYHSMGVAYDDPAWAPFFEFGNEHRLFTLLHPLGKLGWSPGNPQTKGFVELATRYPDLSVLIAHSGGSYAFARAAVWVAKQAPNVFLEITLTPVTSRIIEWLVSEVGADRVLYGTDAPMRDPRPQFGWVVHADIDEAAKRQVLGLNLCRILARCDCNCPAVTRARELLAASTQ